MGLPGRQGNRKGKIAVCSSRNRVCPRFDLTHEMLIFEGERAHDEHSEKVDVSHFSPEKILNMLMEREVTVLICGGIQKRFQQMFRQNDIDVIWGVVGEVHDVMRAYAKGALHPGFGPLSMPKGSR